jgi:hypothetical protein
MAVLAAACIDSTGTGMAMVGMGMAGASAWSGCAD